MLVSSLFFLPQKLSKPGLHLVESRLERAMEKAIALTLILVLVGLLALTVLQVAYQPVRCYYRCVRLFPLGDPAGWSCPGLCWRLDGGFFFDTVR